MSETSKPELKTYRGNCHCGAFVYEATIPEIKVVYSCNCSLCGKKGNLWTPIVDESSFKVVKGDEDNLSNYQFGPKKKSHKFCGTCGSSLLARDPSAPAGKTMVVNVRCIQDLNIWEIPVVKIQGAEYGEHYDVPSYKGPEPAFDAEDSKVYTGSCHCGAVTLAVKTHPLDKEYPASVKECNCSICQRNGYIWIYPKPEQVIVEGKENLVNYSMGRGIMLKPFCKICGIPISNCANDGLSEAEVAALSDEAKMWHGRASKAAPINLRTINGLDLDVLNTERIDGFNIILPKYVNP